MIALPEELLTEFNNLKVSDSLSFVVEKIKTLLELKDKELSTDHQKEIEELRRQQWESTTEYDSRDTLLLILTYISPLNSKNDNGEYEDPIFFSSLDSQNDIVATTTGYFFSISSILKRNKNLKNPLTKQPFFQKDLERIISTVTKTKSCWIPHYIKNNERSAAYHLINGKTINTILFTKNNLEIYSIYILAGEGEFYKIEPSKAHNGRLQAALIKNEILKNSVGILQYPDSLLPPVSGASFEIQLSKEVLIKDYLPLLLKVIEDLEGSMIKEDIKIEINHFFNIPDSPAVPTHAEPAPAEPAQNFSQFTFH